MIRLVKVMLAGLLWAFAPLVLAQTPQPTAAPSQPLLKPAELDQMLAPIALHPDPLLSEILIASTYPLEVVQADRWVKSNSTLKGDALTAALGKQSWDDSVKSLAQVPTVLAMMADQLDWMQKLGDAVLAQQADVMDSIQRLRGRAQANGKLTTTKEQTVTTKTENRQQFIAIEPTSPTEIYVPYYEPAVVYGAWPYPDYMPHYFPPPPGYFAGRALAAGIAFGAAIAVGHRIWGNCDWGRRNINVANRNVNINNFDRNNINSFNKWEHNADHRHGVKYNNADVRQKFAKTDIQAGKAARQDFRGKDGQRVLDPGRPGAGDRPGAGNLPAAGDRPGAGQRPGGADRPGAGVDRPSQRPADRPGGGGAKAAQRPAPKPAQRPAAQRDTAFSHVQSGAAARTQAARGRQSMGGGARVAGGGGRGGGGGGRRSDVALKQDVVLLGLLDNGLGFYRFSYVGSDKTYVGVIAQEVRQLAPEAVVRDRDGYLRVFYDKLGLKMQTYNRWLASGARLPATGRHGD